MPTRVFLADVRDNDHFLRATSHPDTGVVVVSHWAGDVCVASTPVPVTEVANLIGVLAGALEDAVNRPAASAPVALPVSTGWASRAWERIRSRVPPALAEIVALHDRPHRASRDETAAGERR